jgi:hypothetical protein
MLALEREKGEGRSGESMQALLAFALIMMVPLSVLIGFCESKFTNLRRTLRRP